MGFLNFLFGGGPNPADSAQPYLNQIAPMLKQYMSPYIQQGQQFANPLSQQYMQLMQNPGQMMNKIGQGYQQSPGYQFQLGQSLNAANSGSAAQGMLNSPQGRQQDMTVANGLANQDFYNYMNHATGLYNQGLQGAQGMYGMGYNASNGLAENLASVLQSQANLAYTGQENQNKANSGLFGDITGLLGLGGGGSGSGIGGGILDGLSHIFGTSMLTRDN